MINPKLFRPSTLNDKFMGEGLSFLEYCQQTREMIAKARIDISPQNSEFILQSNSPFELRPAKFKKAILLTHGLLDSSFAMRDLANYFFSQGFLVRSILLPGHGTVPGDLLNVTYSEWIKAMDYGVASLKQETDQIYLGGFSLGGTLSLLKAILDEKMSGLILLAPALKLYHPWMLKLLSSYMLIGKIAPRLQWLTRMPQEDSVKYSSICCNSVYQVYLLIKKIQYILTQKSITQPTFIASTAQDETVSPHAILDFFTQLNAQSRLLLYTSDFLQPSKNPQIIQKNSNYPEQNILDFSHTCLPFAPENPHYGAKGDYHNFLHYPQGIPPKSKNIFLGAISKENLRLHTMERLTYNPDFKYMTNLIGKFLGQFSP